MTVPGAEATAARKRELAEAHANQAASDEVLRLIGESPGNLQQVFETIVARAPVLCDAVAAHSGVVNQMIGDGPMAIFGAAELLRAIPARKAAQPTRVSEIP